MATISLPLPPNVLYKEAQQIEFDKIATFIGGNGSGKSTILKSIFDEKLKGSLYEDFKVVCFSSGQNESYSERFAHYLNNERKDKRALSLDCFYYDKSLAKLLVFLSTTGNQNGLVRKFLRHNDYVVENEFEEDGSTKITFDIKVDKAYVSLVEQAKKEEAQGNSDVMTNKAYHLTLSNFINTLADDSYDFSRPLELKTIQLSQSGLSNVSFETDEHTSFDSKIMFFTQAADNDYFVVKKSLNLEFLKVNSSSGEESKPLRLEDLSDGEYQLLFLYALVDLFDRENTLFLFDEADSHLHYKNIDHLWSTFNKISGRALTTTHLIDSISKSGIDKLKVIEKGEIKSGEKISYLASRLKELSEINNTQLKAMSIAENIVFMDDEDDWFIFKQLAIRKLAETEEKKAQMISFLNKFIVIKQESGFEKDSQVFGHAKIKRLDNFVGYLEGHLHNTKNVYLICDRDEYLLNNIGTKKCKLLVQNNGIQKFNKNKLTSHLLSWKRREIKHYLVSPTALVNTVDDLNEIFDLGRKTGLAEGSPGDYDTNGKYNDKLASIESNLVKDLVDPYVKDEVGFCSNKTQAFVNRIPKEEISEDIVEMYNYLVKTNE
ncbi:ATP-binding protein [Shewanella indica]|uniref:AAA family ATPase n=1 Tax=Shewanella indica TaxID=768528 RepID=UPI001F329C3F|nr:AAA family ATPase [Shewanella indica]MCE9793701.1 ATP-binding protein [Shewanella indica]